MYGCGGYSGTANYGASQNWSSFAYSTKPNNPGMYAQGGPNVGIGSYSEVKIYGKPEEYKMPEHVDFSLNGNFLAENRPWTPIISTMGEVQEIVEKTYELITKQAFPHDSIKIAICDEQTFRDIHNSTGGAYSPGIMGFSFNKYGRGTSEIYIKQDHMDSLLLTIGHEIGHVLGPTLPNAQDEEAKAHAFSLAWIETIRENNIGGLQPNIIPNPAQNGLHDVAFDYVKYLLHTGISSFDVFKTLAHGLTSIIAQT